MLKNEDIYTIVAIGDVDITSGLKKVTSHTLSPQGAYTVSRFKSEVERLAKEYSAQYNLLPKEAGIEDTAAFDKRANELKDKKNLNKNEQKELDEINSKKARLISLRKVIREQEVEVNCKPMTYDDWFKFKNENKAVTVDIFGDNREKLGEVELFELIEMQCEGVLWKAPEE